ncbi:unnamed protein product [Didymodactylos carnosus]|nr:unnamed protein product [Didymodactylos carnosus]CAF3994112.1 unnamed protein product [Didymodactylos carnosus]
MPNPINPKKPYLENYPSFLREVSKYFDVPKSSSAFELLDEQRLILLEKAAQGLIMEGKKLGKQREAEWMARELVKVKAIYEYEITTNTVQRSIARDLEVYHVCAHLYTMESFLYKEINALMRLDGDMEYKELLMSKVPTYGPFAYLLFWKRGVRKEASEKTLTVYRCANLSDELIQQYKEKYYRGMFATFPAFTSTSRNRAKAVQFGNVLFVIDIDVLKGEDVSLYSDYPDEEEVILHAGFTFEIQSCKFDGRTNKWIMHLKDHQL